MTASFDPLERIAFLEREVVRLRKGEECHVARPGEGTYECRHDNLCPACRLRSAEARANRESYTIGETEWAQRIATLEHMLSEERENVDTLRARVAELEARTTYTVGETEWAMRVANAEQRFVDEYDAHQETRKLLTDLYMKQLRADAAQMREYGISYHGLRSLFAEYDGGELSIGKVLELLRAAARELAKEEIAELKARITTLEAMKP
jgi:BMFP domain-containing protein YqiC